MIILALDTTSELGSAAVRSAGETLAEVTFTSPEGLAHVVFSAIEQVLRDAGVRLAEIDRFAAASGPGSFTGVRVGLSAVKGLAEAMAKPAVGISNLQALSWFGSLPLRAVVLDARRGQVYAGVYDANLRPVLPDAVLKLSDWLLTLEEPAYQFISPAPLGLEATRFAGMPFVTSPKTLAVAVAACAERAEAQDPAVLDANYVRRADADLFWSPA